MILNSKFNNFVFSLPQGWIFPEIEKKYSIFLKRLPTTFTSITNYINYTIQSVSWPGIEIETVSQTNTQGRITAKDSRNGGRSVSRDYLGGFDGVLSTPKDFTVTFKTTAGFLNFWILRDQIFQHSSYGIDSQPTLQDVQLQILDQYGYLVMTQIYIQPIMYSISELELSYSSNIPEYKTFNVGFKHNGVEFRMEKQ